MKRDVYCSIPSFFLGLGFFSLLVYAALVHKDGGLGLAFLVLFLSTPFLIVHAIHTFVYPAWSFDQENICRPRMLWHKSRTVPWASVREIDIDRSSYMAGYWFRLKEGPSLQVAQAIQDKVRVTAEIVRFARAKNPGVVIKPVVLRRAKLDR